MPPHESAAYGAAQKASHDQLYPALGLSTIELEVLCLDQKHGRVLTAGSAKAGWLLWPAVQTESKHQAQALFAWAR